MVWETSHCIFPLLFLSHSFSAAHASPSLRAFLFSRITMSHIYPRLPAVLFAPLTLLSLPPPSLRWVDRTDIFSALPSFRTLSPCHFLFPVRQLPSVLFLCYQIGRAPRSAVCHLAGRHLPSHFPSFIFKMTGETSLSNLKKERLLVALISGNHNLCP